MEFPMYFGKMVMEHDNDDSLTVYGYETLDGDIVVFKNEIQAKTWCKAARLKGEAAPDAQVRTFDLNVEVKFFLFEQ